MDEILTLMDDFFMLAGEVLASQHNSCLIDRLTTAQAYCHLVGRYPQDDDYRRKFQRAVGDLRSELGQVRESATHCKTLIRPA